jgi:hypothetical protein
MINYTEKGSTLHAAIQKAGHSLREENGVWVSSNDEAVQAIIDSFDPLPGAKLAKWREIQAERDHRTVSGYLVGGNRFHSDQPSRTQQLGLVIMGANLPTGIMWKTMDGAFVSMTPQLAGQIFQTTAGADAAIFGAAEAHRAAVNAMTDWQAIQAYNHTSGWPAL